MTNNLNTQNARQSPEWLTQSVIYQIALRAFTPEGTLKAAAKKLPEVAELGVNILYLCPIFLQDDDPRPEFWSPRQKIYGKNPKNPYRIKDYYRIDPEYGTETDLGEFVETAHQLGLRVLLDLVLAHCGPSAVFIDEHPDFVKRDAAGKTMCTPYGFPILNFESCELREYLWRNMEKWVSEFGVDGYRCDISGCVPLDFWEKSRDRLENIKPDVIMLSEGTKKEDQLHAFDVNYTSWGFSALSAVVRKLKPVSYIRDCCEKMMSEQPNGARFIRFTDNHDVAHATSQGVIREESQDDAAWENETRFYGVPANGLPPDNRHDKALGVEAVNAALVFNFALDGVPFLYNGQEVADTACHNIFAKAPIDWQNGTTPIGRARRTLIQKLCAIRHASQVLSAGSTVWRDNASPEALLSFERQYGDKRILVLVNLGNKSVPSGITGVWKPMIASADSTVEALAPFGYYVGECGSHKVSDSLI
jgi:glycosidase